MYRVRRKSKVKRGSAREGEGGFERLDGSAERRGREGEEEGERMDEKGKIRRREEDEKGIRRYIKAYMYTAERHADTVSAHCVTRVSLEQTSIVLIPFNTSCRENISNLVYN